MSVIYSFLQKRKMHESQHGFIMVLIAYILSALMLALGSDVFYNITSTAASVSTETEEETQKLLNVQAPEATSTDYETSIINQELIDPFGLNDLKSDGKISTSGDTVWLFGDAMDGETFDLLMQQIVSIPPTKTTQAKTKEVSTESLSEKETTNTTYGNISSKEVKMLERIVEAEASGEDMIGKVLIANVIMNRVESGIFPDTIEGVIFQHEDGEYQFSPVANDRYWSVHVSSESKKAVQKALKGEDYSEGALYFVAKKRTSTESARWFDNHLEWLFKHGGHDFYKNK